MKIRFNIQVDKELEWRDIPDFVYHVKRSKMPKADIEREFIKYMEHWYNDEPDMKYVGEWFKNSKPKFKLKMCEEK